MSRTDILQFGNPFLAKTALPLQATKIKTKENQKLINELLQVVKKLSLVLLTAPQIGINKRIIVVYPKRSAKQPTVIINPWIKEKSEKKMYDWEKCISINNNQLYAIVPRFDWISFGGFNQKGKSLSITAKGLEACLIQHGIDHLNGLSFFERMRKKGLKFVSSDQQWRKHRKKLLDEFIKSLK